MNIEMELNKRILLMLMSKDTVQVLKLIQDYKLGDLQILLLNSIIKVQDTI